MKKKIVTYKGFNKDLQCNPTGGKPFQYEVGKTYETKDKPIMCVSGFHSCKHPFDVWNFYPPGENRFAECEPSGDIEQNDSDIKTVSSKLTIKAEITLHKMIEAGIKFIFSKTKKTRRKTNSGYRGAASNSGYSGAASNSGYSGAASNSGYRGAASNSGYSGAASNSGNSGAASNSGDRGAAFSIGNYSSAETKADNSIACSTGIESQAKASLGSWIILAEWKQDKDYNWNIKEIKTAKIDGKKLKADTFYKLKNGKFIKA